MLSKLLPPSEESEPLSLRTSSPLSLPSTSLMKVPEEFFDFLDYLDYLDFIDFPSSILKVYFFCILSRVRPGTPEGFFICSDELRPARRSSSFLFISAFILSKLLSISSPYSSESAPGEPL